MNINSADISCTYIRCRKSNIIVSYTAAKASALSITGVPFLSGFTTQNITLDSDISLTGFSTFVNYTIQNYYGISLSLGSYGATSCTMSVFAYGFVQIRKISSYFITY